MSTCLKDYLLLTCIHSCLHTYIHTYMQTYACMLTSAHVHPSTVSVSSASALRYFALLLSMLHEILLAQLSTSWAVALTHVFM